MIHCFNKDGDDDLRQILRKENETKKCYVRSFDKEGRCSMYMYPGRNNTVDLENNTRHMVYHVERAIACTAKKSGLEKVNLIVDYAGFTVAKTPPLSHSRKAVEILQSHYPERIKRIYFINAPYAFRAFWALVRPFVDPVTKEKIVMCSGSGVGTAMEERFDLAELEKGSGGPKDLRPYDCEEFFNAPFDEPFR